MTARQRKIAFGGTALALLGITIVLTLRERGPETPGDARSQRTTIRTGPPPPSNVGKTEGAADMTPSPTPTASSTPSRVDAGQSEGEPENAPAVASRAARAAMSAARAFLDGYLLYSHPAAPGREGSARRRSSCCASWRPRRLECRLASHWPARSWSPCMPRRRPAFRAST